MNERIFALLTGLLALSAAILSYEGLNGHRSHLEAKVECSSNLAIVTIRNEGAPRKLYYLTVTEGDRIVEIIELNEILNEGESVIEINVPIGNARFSIIFDTGVIGGLKCGSFGRSQP